MSYQSVVLFLQLNINWILKIIQFSFVFYCLRITTKLTSFHYIFVINNYVHEPYELYEINCYTINCYIYLIYYFNYYLYLIFRDIIFKELNINSQAYAHVEASHNVYFCMF